MLKIAKNNFAVLHEAPTCGSNGRFGSPGKKSSINFSKANTKFCINFHKYLQNFSLHMSLHYNADNSYLFVNGRENFKFKTNNKNFNFSTQFCFGIVFNGFRNSESREESLNGNVYDFSVDCNSIDKSIILNIHKWLMNKNDTKQCSVLNESLLY